MRISWRGTTLRIIVLSDSHKNTANVRKIVEKHEDADTFLFLGDGERDFEDVATQYPHKQFEHVCGNCDFYSMAPSLNMIKAQGKRVFYTHGHLYSVKRGTDELLHAAEGWGADVVLYGHTHISHSEYVDGVYLFNPGSCSGMGGSPSYGILDITAAGIVPIIVRL